MHVVQEVRQLPLVVSGHLPPVRAGLGFLPLHHFGGEGLDFLVVSQEVFLVAEILALGSGERARSRLEVSVKILDGLGKLLQHGFTSRGLLTAFVGGGLLERLLHYLALRPAVPSLLL